jgi:hypothetical protein
MAKKRKQRGDDENAWMLIAAVAVAAVAAWWILKRRQQATAAPAPEATNQEAAPTNQEAAPTGEPAVSPPIEAPPVFVKDESEALARVIASEAGQQAREAQTMIAWTARNRATQWKTTIARMVCSPCGKQKGDLRPFSSRFAPTGAHRAVAAVVLAAPDGDDPTKGATHILEPRLMDRLHAAGRSPFDAAMVRWRRIHRDGLAYYGSTHDWDFFGPPGGAGERALPKDPDWLDDGVRRVVRGDLDDTERATLGIAA